MKKLFMMAALLTALIFAGVMFAACTDSNNAGDGDTGAPDTGNIDDDSDGDFICGLPDELYGGFTIINSTDKDIIIFKGMPSASNILGGVRAFSTKTFDLFDDVDDFDPGGYLILRGITLDEYNANKANLFSAKITYSAMATYGQGKKYCAEISPNCIGDYAYKVSNLGRIGFELRKDSPDGEKMAYIPALSTNLMVYSDTSDELTLFPIYVYFNRSTRQVTKLKLAGYVDSMPVVPRPVDSGVSAYQFPNNATWDSIMLSLVSPVAYISVSNNLSNQDARFTIAGSNAIVAQNGYSSISSGEQLTFEVQSTDSGAEKSIVMTLYAGKIQVPVRFAGETNFPTIRNGYDYNVTLTGSGTDAANYSAVITEVGRRDISDVMAF
jgi:hypothetical protein